MLLLTIRSRYLYIAREEKGDLAILNVRILDFVPLARNLPQLGSQQCELSRENAEFSQVCAARYAANANDVSRSEFLVDVLEERFHLHNMRSQ